MQRGRASNGAGSPSRELAAAGEKKLFVFAFQKLSRRLGVSCWVPFPAGLRCSRQEKCPIAGPPHGRKLGPVAISHKTEGGAATHCALSPLARASPPAWAIPHHHLSPSSLRSTISRLLCRARVCPYRTATWSESQPYTLRNTGPARTEILHPGLRSSLRHSPRSEHVAFEGSP